MTDAEKLIADTVAGMLAAVSTLEARGWTWDDGKWTAPAEERNLAAHKIGLEAQIAARARERDEARAELAKAKADVGLLQVALHEQSCGKPEKAMAEARILTARAVGEGEPDDEHTPRPPASPSRPGD